MEPRRASARAPWLATGRSTLTGPRTLEKIRSVVARVPRGRVVTYGEVAAIAGFPGAARLTVRALQQGERLPWHRVVAAGGRIALAGVDGEEQRLRLRMEGVAFLGGRVRLDLHRWSPGRAKTAKRADRASGPPSTERKAS